jgi:hypothetical protein
MYLLEWEMSEEKLVEKIKTYLVFKNAFLSKIVPFNNNNNNNNIY